MGGEPEPTTPILRTSLQKKPEPVIVPVLDTGIQGKENQIPISSTGMTLLPQEEELAPAVIQEQAIKKPTPGVILASATRVKEGNPRGQVTLSNQEETQNNGGNNNIPLKTQSNNRNFYIAATTICTLGTVVCIASAAMTQLVLLGIAATLLIIGAGITSYLIPLRVKWNLSISILMLVHCQLFQVWSYTFIKLTLLVKTSINKLLSKWKVWKLT